MPRHPNWAPPRALRVGEVIDGRELIKQIDANVWQVKHPDGVMRVASVNRLIALLRAEEGLPA